MPLIIVDSYDHPSINSHSTKGIAILKDGASIAFDTLLYNTDIELYILSYEDEQKSNLAILPERIEVIKYG
jgi:hypothetical protein